jgi:hypothetical protein
MVTPLRAYFEFCSLLRKTTLPPAPSFIIDWYVTPPEFRKGTWILHANNELYYKYPLPTYKMGQTLTSTMFALVSSCPKWVAPKETLKFRYGALKVRSLSNTVHVILRLFLYHFLHTMSSWCHKSIHNNTNNQQAPSPWWWSCLPLQQCGFNESTPPKGQAALHIYFPRPLSKDFFWFIKLM